MRDVQNIVRNRPTVEIRRDNGSWRDHALCAHPDRRPTRADDPWYSRNPSDQEYAKSVCGKCPVQPECAKAGAPEKDGIWGGVDKDTPIPYVPRIPRPDSCISCDQKLRPSKAPASAYPGTVSYHGRGLCRSCYRDEQRNGK